MDPIFVLMIIMGFISVMAAIVGTLMGKKPKDKK